MEYIQIVFRMIVLIRNSLEYNVYNVVMQRNVYIKIYRYICVQYQNSRHDSSECP